VPFGYDRDPGVLRVALRTRRATLVVSG